MKTAVAVFPIEVKWDEPDGCSPRGWAHLESAHPDRERDFYRMLILTCGWYLDYSDGHDRGPDGAPILAHAYLNRITPAGIFATETYGHNWFWTIQDAKDWILRAVSHRIAD